MRVDVHTHVWPEKIAEVVLQSMARDMGFPAVAGNTGERHQIPHA